MKRIRVRTDREYDVLIGAGLLADAGELIAGTCPGRRAVVVTDSNVAGYYGEELVRALTCAGFEAETFVFAAGEESKNAGTLFDILGCMADHGLTREDLVVALGGGVTGDMAGLAAAMYMRGIDYVQVPTSILAAVDSSVGGKTAVDLPQGKNLAGAFHQPALVIIDTEVFGTLPRRDYCSGFAEVIKYGMIEEPRILEQIEGLGAYRGDVRQELEELIAHCVSIKADVVAGDEFEGGGRRLLNFGHTVGHAVEKATDYHLYHGEAVAIGMMAMTWAAVRAGRCDSQAADKLERALRIFGLPAGEDGGRADLPDRPGRMDLPDLPDKGALMENIRMDKKSTGDGIHVVIPERVGSCAIEKMTMAELEEFL